MINNARHVVNTAISYLFIIIIYSAIVSCSKEKAVATEFNNVKICNADLWVEFIGQNQLPKKKYYNLSQIYKELNGNYEYISESFFINPLRTACDHLSIYSGKEYDKIRIVNEDRKRVIEAYLIKDGESLNIQLRGSYLK